MASVTVASANSLETLSKPSAGRLGVSPSFASMFTSLKLDAQSETREPALTGISDNEPKTISKQTTMHTEFSNPSSPYLASVDGQLSLTSTANTPDQALSPTDEKVEKLLLAQATAFIGDQIHVGQGFPPLPKPVILPRLMADITSPFVRAWPTELAQHGITMTEFVAFIDNMNILSNPPASSVALSVASIGIGFLPFDGADGLATLAELAAIGVSYRLIIVRCSNLLKKVNEEFFHPRGLHARLVKSKKMKQSLRIPDDDPLIAPLEEATLDMTPHERCMHHLQPYCCELSYDVPPPSPQTKLLQKFAAWNVNQKRKKFDKCSKRSRKRAWKKHQAGKELKREGREERTRAKKLQWLLIQNLDDFEQEERENAAAEEQKQREKQEKRQNRGFGAWPFSKSPVAAPLGTSQVTAANAKNAPDGIVSIASKD